MSGVKAIITGNVKNLARVIEPQRVFSSEHGLGFPKYGVET